MRANSGENRSKMQNVRIALYGGVSTLGHVLRPPSAVYSDIAIMNVKERTDTTVFRRSFILFCRVSVVAKRVG